MSEEKGFRRNSDGIVETVTVTHLSATDEVEQVNPPIRARLHHADPAGTIDPCPLPAGEYAIAEILGHRTLVGRVAEADRFGTKMLQIEAIFGTGLLPAVFIGGASLYAFTPCTREVAWSQRPKTQWDIPDSLRATIPQVQLQAPRGFSGWPEQHEDNEPMFREVGED